MQSKQHRPMTRGWFACSSPPIITGTKKTYAPPAAHLVVRETGEIMCAIPGLEILDMPCVPRGYFLACSRCLEISEVHL